MLAKIIGFVTNPTSKNIIINTSGNYLNVFFIAFFALILFRTMTPVEYGTLSVLLGIAYVLSNILELGTTATIYSTVPTLYQENDGRLDIFLKSTFVYQTVLSALVVVALAVFFPYFDTIFFKTGAPHWLLIMTALTIIMYIWQNFLTNILFAAKKFFRANLYLNISNLIKAIILVALAKTGHINIATVIFTYGFVGPAVFFLMTLFKSSKRIFSLRNVALNRASIKINYTLTYFVASQFYNVGLRMDLFLLSFFGFQEQLGYYASAQKIILSIIATVVSISQVLSPQFASAKTKIEVKKLFRRGFFYMLIPIGIFIALILTPNGLFELVFTKNFDEAILVTKILALTFLLNPIATMLMLFLLYTAKKPNYILIGNIIFFVTMTAGSYFLIPKFGMYGLPYAVFTALALVTLVEVFATIKEQKKLPEGRALTQS